MPLDRLWAILLSAALLMAFVIGTLWRHRHYHRFEVIATFDGYPAEPRPSQIFTASPPKRWAQVVVTRVIHNDFGYGLGVLSIGLPDSVLETDQDDPLVPGRAYSFRFRDYVFKRSSHFSLKVRDLPPAATTLQSPPPPPPATSAR